MTKRKKESVNHPSHYNKGIEVIDIIEQYKMGFCGGNALKYLTRYKFKYKSKKRKLEDLKKAQWYINRLVSNMEKRIAKQKNTRKEKDQMDASKASFASYTNTVNETLERMKSVITEPTTGNQVTSDKLKELGLKEQTLKETCNEVDIFPKLFDNGDIVHYVCSKKKGHDGIHVYQNMILHKKEENARESKPLCPNSPPYPCFSRNGIIIYNCAKEKGHLGNCDFTRVVLQVPQKEVIEKLTTRDNPSWQALASKIFEDVAKTYPSGGIESEILKQCANKIKEETAKKEVFSEPKQCLNLHSYDSKRGYINCQLLENHEGDHQCRGFYWS